MQPCRLRLFLLVGLQCAFLFHRCNGFVSVNHNSIARNGRQSISGSLLSVIPPSASQQDTPPLPSSFPDDTPAGLRGEAIRSALRSRVVAWNLCETPLSFGVVGVSGQGTLNFLNNKLTQTFTTNTDNSYKEACLLTPKGRLVDRIGVAIANDTVAYMMTSPGHTAQQLLDRLDPFIFPLDQVQLKGWNNNKSTMDTRSTIFSLASTDFNNIQRCWDEFIRPKLAVNKQQLQQDPIFLPETNQCRIIPLVADATKDDNNDETPLLLIVPTSGLPSHAGYGYTFCFLASSSTTTVGQDIWKALSQDDDSPAVLAGAREYETLRIEAGQPAFGKEMTAAASDKNNNENDDANAKRPTPASPLELHLQYTSIDFEKGCYLGQEGVASLVKNPRGPPRTLYHVVFDDEFNQSDDDDKDKHWTRVPKAGDALFVLGSNEAIAAGHLTSVAEPSGTGEPETRALGLIRRADSIVSQMKALDLELLPTTAKVSQKGSNGDGVIAPPPLDPLDGLEVIVGGTFTVGRLEMVPSRQRRATNGSSQFANVVPDFVHKLPAEDEQQDILDLSARLDQDDDDSALQEAKKQQQEAEAAAAAEAKRKAEKMEMLRQRAEEAMARRTQKKK